MRFLIMVLIFHFSLYANFDKIQYKFSNEPIDVVIPCALKDKETLEVCLQSIRDYAQNVRRIIVVSKEPLTDSAEWYNERDYPFTLREIMIEIFRGDEKAADAFIAHPRSRATWIFQQFLKFYAPFVIPEISSNTLIVDADLMFLNPVEFMTAEGFPLFNPGTEWIDPYFQHANRLLPGLRRVYNEYSGICNYMLFQRPVLNDLFQLIYSQHKIEAWRALCRCIDHNELYGSCLSEYEIYFNFTLLRTDQYRIKPLKWSNVCDWHLRRKYKKARFAYIVCHKWMREK